MDSQYCENCNEYYSEEEMVCLSDIVEGIDPGIWICIGCFEEDEIYNEISEIVTELQIG